MECMLGSRQPSYVRQSQEEGQRVCVKQLETGLQQQRGFLLEHLQAEVGQ